MKILIINSFYFPEIIGGAELETQLLAEELSAQGNEIIVFCLSYHETKIETIRNIKILRYNIDSQKKRRNTLEIIIKRKLCNLKNTFVAKQLSSVIENYHPDVVQINNLYGMSTLIWSILNFYKLPFVQTLHDYYIFKPTMTPISWWFYKIFKIPKDRKRAASLEHVIAISNCVRHEAMNSRFFTCPIDIIPDGVEINAKETRRIFEEKQNRPDSSPIIFLFAGRLAPEKGIIQLIKAYSAHKDLNNFLVICGDGPLRKTIEKKIKKDKRIRFLGQLSQSELKDMYIKSDVVIVPSIWKEPFGLVTVEAVINGNPVIGSNQGGVKDAISSMKCGALVDVKNQDALGQMIALFSQRSFVKKFLPACENNCFKYSITKTAALYQNYFLKITEKSHYNISIN